MEILEFAIGILVGIASGGLWPEIPLALRGAIRKSKCSWQEIPNERR